MNLKHLTIEQPVLIFNKNNEPFSLSRITEINSDSFLVLELLFFRENGHFINKNYNQRLIKWKPISPILTSLKYPYYKDIVSRIDFFDESKLLNNESLEDYEERVFRIPLLEKMNKEYKSQQLKLKLQNINIQKEQILNQLKNLNNY